MHTNAPLAQAILASRRWSIGHPHSNNGCNWAISVAQQNAIALVFTACVSLQALPKAAYRKLGIDRDSISAWFADKIGASELIVLKSGLGGDWTSKTGGGLTHAEVLGFAHRGVCGPLVSPICVLGCQVCGSRPSLASQAIRRRATRIELLLRPAASPAFVFLIGG